MAAENQRFDRPTTELQPSVGGVRPTPPAPPPYEPTPEEQAYMEACSQAILAGCDAAKTAAASPNADAYLKFANGVKSLTQAYEEIRTGGKVSTGHQGS